MDAAIFGNIVADVIARPIDLQHPPRSGGMRLLDSIFLTTGGGVCNVGIAMSKLGMKVAAAGLVGQDIFGRAMIEHLREAGIDTSCVYSIDQAPTSATVVAVEPSGERTLFHSPGVTAMLDANVFRKCFRIFKQCAWIQIGYFGLLPAMTRELPQLLIELKQIAPGAKIALDTVDPTSDWDLLEPILPHLDLFAPSRPEATMLTGENTPRKMAARFREQMKEGIIGIKLDSEGCHLDDGARGIDVPAYKVDVVDTTGAGDSWFAGLLTGLRQNLPLELCARLANRVAADCCTALGASAGVRSYKETIAAM